MGLGHGNLTSGFDQAEGYSPQICCCACCNEMRNHGNTADPLSQSRSGFLPPIHPSKTIFRLMERDFWVNPGVFPPNVFLSTTFFSQDLQYPVGGSFWKSVAEPA